MMNFHNHTAEELAADSSFANWVLRSDERDTRFWEEWIARNTDRQEIVTQARRLVLAVHELHQWPNLTNQEITSEIRQLVEHAQNDQERPETKVRPLWQGGRLWWQSAAAAVLLLIGGVWFSQRVSQVDAARGHAARSEATDRIVRQNLGNRPMTVLLSDGSVVTLNRNSRLTYPRVFAKELRVVTLAGEAFFEVSKNPRRPFLVFTDRSVTKVLGTSFRVRAFAREPNVNVVVRTGKVAVYALDHAPTEKKLVNYEKGVLLLPNQQVDLTAGQLHKRVVASPALAAATQVGPSEITFDDQPVADVLLTLSRLYEIDINFDDKALEHCRITTSFSEETLPERLSSICRAINASYTIENDKIDVSSRGCLPVPTLKTP